jgi:hypothetical protein
MCGLGMEVLSIAAATGMSRRNKGLRARVWEHELLSLFYRKGEGAVPGYVVWMERVGRFCLTVAGEEYLAAESCGGYRGRSQEMRPGQSTAACMRRSGECRLGEARGVAGGVDVGRLGVSFGSFRGLLGLASDSILSRIAADGRGFCGRARGRLQAVRAMNDCAARMFMRWIA